jgi:hypothetical protein
MDVEGWEVGDSYVHHTLLNVASLISSQCTLRCARKRVRTHRGDYEADRKDISSYESHAARYPEAQSWRHRLVAQDCLFVHKSRPFLPQRVHRMHFVLIQASIVMPGLHGY